MTDHNIKRGAPHASKTKSAPKNATYERALSAFFEGHEPSEDQKKQLPDDVEGVSARRQALIESVLSSETTTEQLSPLRRLRLRFGLPSDIRIINLALGMEDESLAIEGLQSLKQWLESRSGDTSETMKNGLEAWRSKLNHRVDTLLFRSFNPKIQELASQCSRLLI